MLRSHTNQTKSFCTISRESIQFAGEEFEKLAEAEKQLTRARQWRTKLEVLEKELLKKLEQRVESHSSHLGSGEIVSSDYMSYRSRAQSAWYVIIPGLIIDITISTILSHGMFWMLPAWLAYIIGGAWAILFAALAHGVLILAFGVDRPLRTIKILRMLMNTLIILNAICFIPYIFGRIVPLPVWLTSISIGATSWLLPIMVGSASAVRRMLMLAYPSLLDRMKDCRQALRQLNDFVSFAEDFVSKHVLNMRQSTSDIKAA